MLARDYFNQKAKEPPVKFDRLEPAPIASLQPPSAVYYKSKDGDEYIFVCSYPGIDQSRNPDPGVYRYEIGVSQWIKFVDYPAEFNRFSPPSTLIYNDTLFVIGQSDSILKLNLIQKNGLFLKNIHWEMDKEYLLDHNYICYVVSPFRRKDKVGYFIKDYNDPNNQFIECSCLNLANLNILMFYMYLY